ncbi:Maintenance of telomere capping protein 1 [Metarhizium brunneum]|uniref:Maintenance of telomere capping protein 1 n=1 Tax=Metarhizium brunneum TaxID=500148 RepID=A0A7D5YW03_9HYPO
MASKKTKAAASAADDNLDELFQGIGDDAKSKKPTNPKSTKTASSASKTQGDDDILADLESQLASEKSASRPHTPRGVRRPAGTPPVGDDKATAAAAAAPSVRKSTDSARSLRANLTPSATSSEPHEAEKKGAAEQSQQQQSGGGWWGGILSTATGVMKQAENAYKEIQQNEEAKKWADQVRGLSGGIDVGALRNYGDELRTRALPTFTNILHTLAPPISSHERLMIHITHDLVGYPSLDPLVHGVFARVMSQVEGGDLLVVQRGRESSSGRYSDGSAGWRDGPWWRQTDSTRELGLVKGMIEGTKLCRAGAESYANEYFASHGGIEQAKTRATEDLSESNPVRTSDIFLSVQAISTDGDKALFAGSASAVKEKETSAVKEQDDTDELVCFAVYVLDPVHEIEFSTVSQSIPSKWVRWLDAASPLTPRTSDENQDNPFDAGIPEDIKDIIESGGVDPREWVAEWIEETLCLSVGVVAQRYVARRMGVGEGGLGRGKKRVDELIEANAGEVARAGII